MLIAKVMFSYVSLFIDGYLFLFFGLSTKNKKRNNLCELCASAVKCLIAQVEYFRQTGYRFLESYPGDDLQSRESSKFHKSA